MVLAESLHFEISLVGKIKVDIPVFFPLVHDICNVCEPLI